MSKLERWCTLSRVRHLSLCPTLFLYLIFSLVVKQKKVTHFVENVLTARKIRDAGSISVGYVRTSNYEVKVFHTLAAQIDV